MKRLYVNHDICLSGTNFCRFFNINYDLLPQMNFWPNSKSEFHYDKLFLLLTLF